LLPRGLGFLNVTGMNFARTPGLALAVDVEALLALENLLATVAAKVDSFHGFLSRSTTLK